MPWIHEIALFIIISPCSSAYKAVMHTVWERDGVCINQYCHVAHFWSVQQVMYVRHQPDAGPMAYTLAQWLAMVVIIMY